MKLAMVIVIKQFHLRDEDQLLGFLGAEAHSSFALSFCETEDTSVEAFEAGSSISCFADTSPSSLSSCNEVFFVSTEFFLKRRFEHYQRKLV